MKFKVTGKFKIGNKTKPFSKIFDVARESMVKHIVFSYFGNTYRMVQRNIIIEKITKA
ncbi:50S ribosomal protein L18Ae [uncultured archaeon]|nr:50S ribosomal protein L18Ae [uncultured archaeon]